MTLQSVVLFAVSACFVYLLAVFAAFVVMLIFSALEHARLGRQSRNEDYEALSESHFTIPVSVIVPAYNEEVVIEGSVRSLLSLNYPEFEIIVVNDGSTDDTLGVLTRAFDLERREVFYRRRFGSRPVRGVYRSRQHPNLLVLDKENGGKADALNAGLNLARLRYVCTVDADTIYYPQALLSSMRVPMRDPGTIIGVTSQVTISRRPEVGGHERTGTQRVDGNALTDFQLLDYMRAFVNNRVGWSRWNFMLCSVGAFAVWRQDVVEELGGFSGAFTCEDIEFTFRVHEHFRRLGLPYRIVALAESVGRTEGPDSVGSLVSQRARWQRVITETVWHYRRMLFNPTYGAVAFIGAPYYVLVEVLAPFFQVLALVVAPAAWALGLLEGRDFVMMLVAMTLANGILTNLAALNYARGPRSYPLKDLLHLMGLGVADLFLYRPVLIYAQAKGAIDFLRGDKQWHKFARNRRA